MINKMITIIIVSMFLITMVAAAPYVKLKQKESLDNNINSSSYWDSLDEPSDISGSIYWYNHTSATYNLWNTIWSSTYNATYDAIESDNSSWNESYANTLYTPIGSGSDNESWNQSYATTLFSDIQWAYNQTLEVFGLYNNTWDNSWVNIFAYNHTEDTYNLYNEQWISTYNATYDANIDSNCSSEGSCGLITYDSELDYYTDVDIDGSETAFNGWDKDNSDDITSWDSNLAWINESNEFTVNQNLTGNNMTDVDCIVFSSGGKICSGS